MQQEKIGQFLKQLRKEKGLTQEQLAEKLSVSGRTVSRWETGSNMPDLSILVEIADFYDVDIREIIDGERKSENMNKEKQTPIENDAENKSDNERKSELMDENMRDTLEKVADYSKEHSKRKMKKVWIAAIIFAAVLTVAVPVLAFVSFAVVFDDTKTTDSQIGPSWGEENYYNYSQPQIKNEYAVYDNALRTYIDAAIKARMASESDYRDLNTVYRILCIKDGDGGKVLVYTMVYDEAHWYSVDFESSGSTPCLFNLEKTNGSLSVTSVQYPRDGAYYNKDLEALGFDMNVMDNYH